MNFREVLPTRRVATPELRPPDQVVVVTDHDGAEVVVRWRLVTLPDAWRWRCAVCGPMAEAGCAHTFAAGLRLAEDLLGLTRLPELAEAPAAARPEGITP